VLGIFGGQDQSIPTTDVQKFEDALNANNITNEIYVYEGVGHAFANPTGESFAPDELKDAWQKTLEFLNKNLKDN
ncbi:MAG: dienelactone hydrolase family protein, partial [Thermoproteota archaeon]|nr:dienelactone hydrolase family protein [Thermoproteota archaeon]